MILLKWKSSLEKDAVYDLKMTLENHIDYLWMISSLMQAKVAKSNQVDYSYILTLNVHDRIGIEYRWLNSTRNILHKNT